MSAQSIIVEGVFLKKYYFSVFSVVKNGGFRMNKEEVFDE